MNLATMLRVSGAAVVLVGALAAPAGATSLIVNGGFESGFAGWTRADQIGSDGTFFVQSGLVSPVNGLPVQPPPEGAKAAMSDGGGPGAHVLYQDFAVGAAPYTSAIFSFALFIGNWAPLDEFASPNTLDFSINDQNQQVRVDILGAGSAPFSLLLTDVLGNFYRSMPGDAAISGYTSVSVDIAALLNANLGQTLRVRFAETDNLGPLNFGVDNVALETASAVPEPASLVLLGTGLLAGLRQARRRRQAA